MTFAWRKLCKAQSVNHQGSVSFRPNSSVLLRTDRSISVVLYGRFICLSMWTRLLLPNIFAIFKAYRQNFAKSSKMTNIFKRFLKYIHTYLLLIMHGSLSEAGAQVILAFYITSTNQLDSK